MLKITCNEQEIIRKIDLVVNKTMSMDLEWSWPCGVAYYGISKVYEVLKNKTYLELLKSRIDEYIELGLPSFNVNACAMGHVLMTLYEATGEEKYLKIISDKIEYINNKAVRFGDNVLQHTVSSNNDFPEQAWADTLFMAAFFLLRVGIYNEDKMLIEDALNQYYWHIEYLQDEAKGLWYHGYNNINKDHMSGFYWARANAWAAYTMSQVGKRLPECYLYPKYLEVECALRDQLAALKLLQTENGLWRTILDDEESYEEVSASCGIAAAMLEVGNPLYSKYVQKALDAICANISEDGRVLNVSGGTAVMRDRQGYMDVPKKWMQGWGQGLALAFLAAVLENQNEL